jgi:RPA family protein
MSQAQQSESSSTESENTSPSDDGVSRETAVPATAALISAARRELQVGDDDQSAKYGVLPTGNRMHRVVVAGVLTNIDLREKNTQFAELNITDPFGTTLYSYPNAEFQTDVYQRVQRLTESDQSPPMWVIVVGKVSPFQNENGDWLVSLKPEEFQVVTEGIVEEVLEDGVATTLDMVDDFLQREGEAESFASAEYSDRVAQVKDLVRSTEDILANTNGIDVDLPETDDSASTDDDAVEAEDESQEAEASG